MDDSTHQCTVIDCNLIELNHKVERNKRQWTSMTVIDNQEHGVLIGK